jgi:hypothetical protein
VYVFVYVKGGLDYLHVMMVRDGMRYLWKAFCINQMQCLKNIFTLLTHFFRKNAMA